MVSNEFFVLFLAEAELMSIQSAFIGNLVSHVLRMMPGWDALVNDFSLAFSTHKVGIDKLSHFNVVSNDINR